MITDSEAEIEIVDDTPPEDRNRVPSDPPEELTEEELNSYSSKRLKTGLNILAKAITMSGERKKKPCVNAQN